MFKILVDFFVGTVLFIIFLILKVLGKRISSNLCATIFSTFGALTKFEHIAKKNILYVIARINKDQQALDTFFNKSPDL